MPGHKRRARAAADHGAEPMLITEWEEFVVEGGILFVRYWCGPTPYCVAMGPAMAFDAIGRAQYALSRGIVEKLIGTAEHH